MLPPYVNYHDTRWHNTGNPKAFFSNFSKIVKVIFLATAEKVDIITVILIIL